MILSNLKSSYPDVANTHRMDMGLLQGMLLCSNNVLLLLITLARPRLPGEVDVHELQSSLEPLPSSFEPCQMPYLVIKFMLNIQDQEKITKGATASRNWLQPYLSLSVHVATNVILGRYPVSLIYIAKLFS